ncbi:hypothetical protein ABZ208_03150 [Streptomyces sp. NPDC006208]|uniref:hypothetical protein n=1 Tax=Streptomyces sp. NPDC006208 TaxID=3156734 RepID=UPI0033A90B27
MGICVRETTVDDCEAVAVVRVRGRQYAYAGLMPQSLGLAAGTACHSREGEREGNEGQDCTTGTQREPPQHMPQDISLTGLPAQAGS